MSNEIYKLQKEVIHQREKLIELGEITFQRTDQLLARTNILTRIVKNLKKENIYLKK